MSDEESNEYIVIGPTCVLLIVSQILWMFTFSIENIFYFIIGIVNFLCLIASIMCIYNIEYNRIKREDFGRIKKEIQKHIRSCYPEETFSLIDEKEFTRKEILKRCFRTYELTVHAFAHHGELVYQVKVNKDEVWLKDFKQVSNVNFVKEFCKK